MTMNKPCPPASERAKTLFFETVRELDSPKPGEKVLIALSGGKDSVCLLHLFVKYHTVLGVGVCACHVHHGMRKAAERDALFCRELCKEYGVEYFERRVRVPEYAKAHGLSPEMAARKLRYEALLSCAHEQGAILASAHTASDNTENVLLALLRGGGIGALSGIAPKRADGVIRPLSCFTSDLTLGYCRENGLSFVTDLSNRDRRYPRNFLRAEIVPRLKTRNPRLDQTVLRLTRILQTQRLALEESFLKERAALKIEHTDRGAPLALLRPLAQTKVHHALLYDLLSGFLKAAGDPEPLPAERFDAIVSLLCADTDQARRAQVPGGYAFTLGGGMLYAEKSRLPDAKTLFFDPETLKNDAKFAQSDEKTVDFCENLFRFSSVSDGFDVNVYKFHTKTALDCDKIIGCLAVRNAKPDDTVTLNGRQKSVAKLLSSRKYPVGVRRRFPVLCDERGVLWIPGETAADRAAFDKTSAESDLRRAIAVELISGEIYEILLQKRRQYE